MKSADGVIIASSLVLGKQVVNEREPVKRTTEVKEACVHLATLAAPPEFWINLQTAYDLSVNHRRIRQTHRA